VLQRLSAPPKPTLSSILSLQNLSAALANMNHQILLSTLSGLGISSSAHCWIASYLAV
jgi:hypothetical protein